MGQPVRIYELAERMIRLAGYEPGEDIEIAVTGTRPGERMHEILFARDEPMAEIGIDGVMAAKPIFADRNRVNQWLTALAAAIEDGDREAAEQVFEDAIPEFKHRSRTPQPLAPAEPARLASG
jgi:O-antigen biosynthesis protein WbqV